MCVFARQRSERDWPLNAAASRTDSGPVRQFRWSQPFPGLVHSLRRENFPTLASDADPGSHDPDAPEDKKRDDDRSHHEHSKPTHPSCLGVLR